MEPKMLQPGNLVRGQYEIQQVLGTGSFSTVYLAFDARFPGGRRVAIKEFNPAAFPPQDQAWARDTIAQEARLRGRLPSHSGLANVLDYFEAEDRAYLVMEYVEGVTLEALLRQQPGHRFPEAQVLDWAAQLADVLTFLHGQSPPIVYRDLKPANVMRRPDGQLVLIDFGIARLHRPERSDDTINLGTIGYAAPEQYQQQQSDARSDVYALGVILHQLLSGVEPREHVFSLPRLREVSPGVSLNVAAAIEQATAHSPEQRFRSVQAFRAALLGAHHTPPATAAPARWRRVLPGVFVLLVVVAAGAALLLRPGSGGQESGTAAPRTTPSTRPVAEGPVAPVASATSQRAQATMTAADVSAVEASAVAAPKETAAIAPETTVTDVTAEATAPTRAGASATAPANLGELPPTWVGIDGKTMVLVPAGRFLMGSTEAQVRAAASVCLATGEGPCGFEQFANEMPQRSVFLDAFYVDQTEVTNGEYAACVEAQACGAPVATQDAYRPQDYYLQPAFAGYPVVYVTWYDARAYCRWAGEALPTEAQWEKAARGSDGRLFPWGNEWDCNRANTEECGGKRLHAGGAFVDGASPYGALDMAGNVWEWVEDAFDAGYYSQAPDENPPAASSGAARVLRGGGYSSFQHFARVANRGFDPAGTASSYRGFRCALAADQIVP